MKKLSPVGMKWLKIVHISLVALFFGGIMSSLALNMGISLATYDDTLATYKRIVVISDSIIRTGAVGTLLVGFVYGFLTSWGFFKHRWVTVKWILFVGQTIIGIFVVDKLMLANMTLLETEKALALTNPEFLHNQTLRQYAIYVQVAVTVFILCISVFRPWKKKKQAVAT
ncbi:hypothetical protein PAECIP111891_02795 [Paenibacillus allorhizoplanae]|uniref:DUF2269 family protein n=1 Tax=Paenibacillus allorhizoplanae TaxID=2905648 RepID=A0ABN8GJQ0_9BACL|nr:DUF2269 family protein [Paenibacillus allorhizoplanae]CAH1206116.1 hypothetical protein PAECIP111891_02795 [Paenibacillus allorhizoplanae]